MPELPEVESVARSLWDGIPSLQGKTIHSISLLSSTVVDKPSPEMFINILQNTMFISLNRFGKYLFFGVKSLTGEIKYLVIHLRMTGRLHLVQQCECVEQHTRLILNLDSGLSLRFDDPRKFGRAWLVENPEEVTVKLGPDALTVDFEQFSNRLSRIKRQLKPLLLDQSFISGIGNIYADEILFRCTLHPLRLTTTLTNTEIVALHSCIHEVLVEAVATKGANIDGVFKAGKFPVAVYGRSGKACQRCGAVIEKIKVGQRGTSLCPTCQPVN